MSEGKLELWDRLSKTDPAHTKQFTRAGGFKGTAIKPMWAIKRATEEFGPIGSGWGFEEDEHLTIPCDDGQVLVYVRARVWYNPDSSVCWTGPQWGGDFVVKKNKHGLNPDDEAFKKALTDAVMKCLAYIGIGADVHMGQFDDQKYVDGLRAEFNPPQLTPEQERMQEAMEKPHVHEAVDEIKTALSNGDLATAAAAWWDKLDDDDKKAVWLAPSKGGVFSTQERETIKSTEFRQAYYGAPQQEES